MSSERNILDRSAHGQSLQPVYSIRRATAQDFSAALALVKEYFEAIDVWVRDDESEFRDYLTGDDRGIWLAFASTEPVGCIVLHPLEDLPRSGELKRLYVKPMHRRQGLADALLQAVEAFAAKAAGYAWLYLDSKDDLKNAIRFYRRNGYESCHRYNANPQATIFMRKALAGA
jgi:GNAT superfamily N-acetyltransferase